MKFQCSSASRKFLNGGHTTGRIVRTYRFSALQRAENSSMMERFVRWYAHLGFSALQRAENSSINNTVSPFVEIAAFQCSSASRKFLNQFSLLTTSAGCGSFSALQRAENSSIGLRLKPHFGVVRGFSALQRAENSSIVSAVMFVLKNRKRFQCSSASRKFLNALVTVGKCSLYAMFQCSSASRKFLNLKVSF